MPEPIAAYVRVSTQDQSLERQLTATHQYAQDTLGADAAEIQTYRDKSTGTNTDRSGYQAMMAAVEGGDHDVVVAHSIDRIARSLADFERTAEHVTDAGAELHLINESIRITPDEDDPMQNLIRQMMGAFAEFEANIIRQRTREGLAARMANDEYHHGPPPIGFTKDNGRLIEADNYHTVCTVLEQVVRGELSKRKAARELGTTRTTVRSAINDRGELYGIEVSADAK